MFYIYISIKFKRILSVREVDLDARVVAISSIASVLCDMLMRKISIQ